MSGKVDRMIELLEEIRNALVAPAPAIVDELLGCSHPEEKRISLRAMGSGEHWQCGDCGYVQEPAGVASN